MSVTLFLALLVNITVGAYLAWGYPRTVANSFRGRTPPPVFALLLRVMPLLGKLLVAASVLYGLLVAARLLP
jgi:hypothetical protein